MLLTISTTHRPARDLGFLLHKHPDRVHERDLPFGRAVVFYPEATDERCTAALLLDIDPVSLVRGRPGAGGDTGLLRQYVNDRPYAASSFLSVAIAQSFATAMGGRSKRRETLAATPLPLEATIAPLHCGQTPDLVERLFAPLGYAVTADGGPLDATFPDWGPSPYRAVHLRATCSLADLLNHLYVLIPVLDNEKHYWVGRDELEKLLRKGEGWLKSHPEQELITRRYLRHKSSLVRAALERLSDEDSGDQDTADRTHADEELTLERPIRLNDLRLDAVTQALLASGARRVVDLGCGEARLLSRLLKEKQFEEIVGVDVSPRALEIAGRRLRLDEMAPRQRERIKLLQGALTYRDKRLTGFDAAALVEVIEHLDPPRLDALERVVFDGMRPRTVIVTTPNREYNAKFEFLPAGALRHRDHRFEWTRAEFRAWTDAAAERHGYSFDLSGIGEVDAELGPPTQMAVFTCA